MFRRAVASPTAITAILLLQFVPLVLFPPASFAPTTQEWWLSAMLAVLVIVADFYLLVRHTTATWPWNLISFAQGFNIISRLMMLWPHATVGSGSNAYVNWAYIVLTLSSILLSVFMLWFTEQPEVHMRIAARA
jgi:hypothetical protein